MCRASASTTGPQLGRASWRYRGSVFDGYEAIEQPGKAIKKVAVAVGSQAGYGFRRLLEASLRAIPDGAEVTWQTGSTSVEGLPIEARAAIASEQLQAEFAAADVVIVHAGVGLSLLALSAGRCPVLVPRRVARGEHVDDHQREVAAELDRLGLAVACEADQLTTEHLERAAAKSAFRLSSPPVFRLDKQSPSPSARRSLGAFESVAGVSAALGTFSRASFTSSYVCRRLSRGPGARKVTKAGTSINSAQGMGTNESMMTGPSAKTNGQSWR